MNRMATLALILLGVSGCAQGSPSRDDGSAAKGFGGTVFTAPDAGKSIDAGPGGTTAADTGGAGSTGAVEPELPPEADPNGPHVAAKGETGAAGAAAGGEVIDLQPLDEPDPLAGESTEQGAIDLAPKVAPSARVRKRMTIDQLDAALQRVSGGIAWTAKNGKNELTTLAVTLGKPNFTDLTTEDLEPSSLFQKFLADAAQSVCSKLTAADKKQTSAAKRQLIRHVKLSDTIATNPAGVNKNLAYLLLRYHSRMVAPGATELQPWRFLFESATMVSGNKPDQAWRTVCVAMIVHPHFYTY